MRTAVTLLFALAVSSCGGAGGPAVAHAEPGASPGAEAPPRAGSVGVNEGALTESDPVDERRAHYHVWQVHLDPSRRVRVHMASSAFDPLIELRGPGAQRLRNDDGLPGTNDAMVDFVPEAEGTYEIRATSYAAGEHGTYTLTVETRGLEGIGARIALSGVTRGTVGESAQAGLPGSWLHFDGEAGSIVRLRVTSSAFDTVATLLGPGGQTWMNDDANDIGPDGTERSLDSTIVAALPVTGVYQLVVSPYGAGEGAFSVRTEVRPPVLLTDEGGRPDGLAGERGGGRLLGVYAGISAYPTQGALFGCADDARLLAEAMRGAHLQDESDQLVLPESLATREGLLAGIADMAARARPEDVVLVFFSGHGQQTPDAPGGDEIDQLDETIVLFDESITDDALVEALDAIQAGTVILAIDSCHSGGFADDWVGRPGRVGIFSSDEDVLSDTAEPHGAGGYLSWHLRRGVLGEADSRPRDGVLHAGELTDYINDGFVRDHRLMNEAAGLEPSQRLVVRRGAVTWDQVLWVYPRNRDLSLPALPDLPLTSPVP